MIEMGKKYQTRDGKAVRILCTDLRAGATCILGLIAVADDEEMVGVWAADGRAFPWRTGNPNDLIPVSTKHEGWVVVGWQNEDGCYLTNKVIWNTRQEAVEQASHLSGIEQFIAHVTWED